MVKQFTETLSLECENLALPKRKVHIVQVRHQNCPTALLSTVETLAHYGINIEEMRTVMLEGKEAGVTTITVTEGNIHNIKEILADEILKSEVVYGVDI